VKKVRKLCADMLDTVGAELQVVNKSQQAVVLEMDAFVTLTPDQSKEASSEVLRINFGGNRPLKQKNPLETPPQKIYIYIFFLKP